MTKRRVIIGLVAFITLLFVIYVTWKYSLCYHITYNIKYCRDHFVW
ncbi:MAG: hypothetical protein ACRDFQ_07750 [Anaerolineales bacterium]